MKPLHSLKETEQRKNEHRVTVKVDFRKREERAKRFVRACEVEVHMDISQVGNCCASRRKQKPGPAA